MVRKWSVLWCFVLLVLLAGQASAIQVSPIVTPSKPKSNDKMNFNVTVTNNGTDIITSVVVDIAYSFWQSQVMGMYPDQPNPNDDSVSTDVAPGAKTTFHATLNLAQVAAKLGNSSSFTYNFTVYYSLKINGSEVNRTDMKTIDYTVTISKAPAAKKSPGFEGLLLVPAAAMAAILLGRRGKRRGTSAVAARQ